jgi:hypothetical protein
LAFHSLAFSASESFVAYEQVQEQLAELGVDVVMGNRATVEGGTTESIGGTFPMPTQGPCVVRAGALAVSADLVLNCIGMHINAQASRALSLVLHLSPSFSLFLQVSARPLALLSSHLMPDAWHR